MRDWAVCTSLRPRSLRSADSHWLTPLETSVTSSPSNKEPSLRVSICAVLENSLQDRLRAAPWILASYNLKHPCIDRHQASRVDCLYIIHSLPHDSSLNSKFAAQPVHVSPFERKTLTDAQTKTNTNQRTRVNGFFKSVDEHPEFIHCQVAGLTFAPG